MTVQRYDNQGLPAYPSDGDDTFVRSVDYDGMESAWRNACERGDKAVAGNAALRARLAEAERERDEWHARAIALFWKGDADGATCGHVRAATATIRQLLAADADDDSLAAENAALRAELAFARSTGDESALEYHALKTRLAEAEQRIDDAKHIAVAGHSAAPHQTRGSNLQGDFDAIIHALTADSASPQRTIDLELIREQAEQGVMVEHDCPAMYACACILAEFEPPSNAETVNAVDQQSGAQHE